MTPEENLKVKSLTEPTDVFNHVIDHLRKQGFQSLFGERATCAYRGDRGAMCAVGVLIADDEYDFSLENKGITLLVEQNLLNPDLKKRIAPNLEMLIDLQEFHDNFLEYQNGAFTGDSETHINNLREKWSIK